MKCSSTWRVATFLPLIVCLLVPSQTTAEPTLAILPAQVTLSGSQARHRVVVMNADQDLYIGEVSDARLESSDPAIVTVTDGVLIPVANGQATITARSRKRTATAQVEVVGMNQPHEWTFRNHVLPVLSKAGCNSGACHGALAGKGGFKLSLRGYDPKSDHYIMTRQARGRRVELSDPGRSLVLAKPSGGFPHKGGVRFEVNSPDYQVLAEWIANGAKPPAEKDASLERLEILPALSVLAPNAQQQVLVRAFYSDGRVEDVTQWTKFASANETVLKVDHRGQLNVMGFGEGAVTAWFSQKIAIARVSVPYENDLSPDLFAKAPRKNFLDDLVLEQLQRLNLCPSPKATDQQFLRRVYIDTIGTLPTAEETRKFLTDTAGDKRDRLIEHLLGRPEFVDYWTYKWSDVMLINGRRLRPKAVKAYYQWIHGHVAANTPWDQFVREIVTAQGGSLENGATNFYALHQDPESMMENVSQAFMGLSIGCAKCHNHPLEKWTNNQYYAMANLFSRVRAKGWGGDGRSGDGIRTLFVAPTGELVQPLTGKPQPPTPLDGEPISFDSTTDRRIHLANWLTSPENPYFARAITNRVWANFFGVGLVEAVDDMRATNPASNEELLAATSQYLVDQKFDLKALMRLILHSETYQRGSQPLADNQAELRFYSRYYPRRMMAEVLLDAISQVTQVPSEFTEVAFAGADRQKTDFYPKGTRAIQLYDSAVDSYFLKTFGRNSRDITCECERSDEPSMVQVLHISNGDTVNEKLTAKESYVSKLLDAGMSREAMIDEVFLTALSRFPTADEKKQLLTLMSEASDDRIAVEDLFWSVISSREFLFNH